MDTMDDLMLEDDEDFEEDLEELMTSENPGLTDEEEPEVEEKKTIGEAIGGIIFGGSVKKEEPEEEPANSDAFITELGAMGIMPPPNGSMEDIDEYDGGQYLYATVGTDEYFYDVQAAPNASWMPMQNAPAVSESGEEINESPRVREARLGTNN